MRLILLLAFGLSIMTAAFGASAVDEDTSHNGVSEDTDDSTDRIHKRSAGVEQGLYDVGSNEGDTGEEDTNDVTDDGSDDKDGDSAEDSMGSEPETVPEKRWDYKPYIPDNIMMNRDNIFLLALISKKKAEIYNMLNVTCTKLQGLPPADEEGSEANLKRWKFFKRFVGKCSKVITGKKKLPGQYSLQKAKGCMAKTEISFQLMKDTNRDVQKKGPDSRETPRILLTCIVTSLALLKDEEVCTSDTDQDARADRQRRPVTVDEEVEKKANDMLEQSGKLGGLPSNGNQPMGNKEKDLAGLTSNGNQQIDIYRHFKFPGK